MDAPEQKIEFINVTLVHITNLPLHLIGRLESIQFELHDKSSFYAIGGTNESFEDQEQVSNTQDCPEEMAADGFRQNRVNGKAGQFRIEKFFIECEETFQSETMAFFDLPSSQSYEPFSDITEQVVKYENS